MAMKSYKITTVIEKDKHGYSAFCPELDGCCTQGRTIDEAMKNIREAVCLYLETLSPKERAALSHHEIMTSSLEVCVA
jgi:predicted RNase H-like HicB family nuclease